MEYKRNCPKCGKEIIYSSYMTHWSAKKNSSKCSKCAAEDSGFMDRYASKGNNTGKDNAFFGRTHSEETKEKMRKVDRPYLKTKEFSSKISKVTSGKNNPMYGKSYYDIWVKKYGKEEADRRRELKRERNRIAASGSNNPMYGKQTPDGAGNGWKGWYKGWFFRSLRELSYFIKEIERKGLVWEKGENKKFIIKYLDYKGTNRTYRPDFFVDNKYLIEVKPEKLKSSQTVRAKQLAAIDFCKIKGWEYLLVDVELLSIEEFIKLYKNKEISFVGIYDKMFRERYLGEIN